MLKYRYILAFLAVTAVGVSTVLMIRWNIAAKAGLAPTRFIQVPGEIAGMRFSRDGTMLMAEEGSGPTLQLTFRDPTTGNVLHQWPCGRGEKWLSDDGKFVVETIFKENSPTRCLLHATETGQVLRRWTGRVIDIRPDFTLMVGRDESRGSVPLNWRVSDVVTGHIISHFLLPQNGYWDARLSRTFPYLCLTDHSHSSKILHLPDMNPVVVGMPPLQSLQISRDGTRAIGISSKGQLHFWQLPSGVYTTIAIGMLQTDWASDLPNGDVIAQGVAGTPQKMFSCVRVWSKDATRLLNTVPGSPEAYSNAATDVMFGPSDQTGKNVGEVWDCMTGRRSARLNLGIDALGQPGYGYSLGCRNAAISPDGHTIAVGTTDGLLRLYKTGGPVKAFDASMSREQGHVVNPGTGLSIAGTPSDMLDATPNIPKELKIAGKFCVKGGSAVSPNGRFQAVLWSELEKTIPKTNFTNVISSNGMLELRDARTGKVIFTLSSIRENTSRSSSQGALGKPVFSPDSTRLASADDSGVVQVWDTTTGHKLGQISGTLVHNGGRMMAFANPSSELGAQAAFVPGNQTLVVSRDDGSLYLYSLKTWLPIAQIGQTDVLDTSDTVQPSHSLRQMTVTPDGKSVYGLNHEATVTLSWDIKQ